MAPIFLVVVLGWFLKHYKCIDDNFTNTAEKLVFRLALPVLLFCEVTEADLSTAFDGKFILFCCLGIVAVFILLCLIVPLFIRSNDRRGAFIQGAYRSNFAILGIPLAVNMFGDDGAAQIAMMMPFAITFFNVLAVLVLSIFAPREKRLSPLALLKKIGSNIITNPLILSVIAALPFLFFPIELPLVMTKSLGYLSNLATPLSLICIGANFSFDELHGRLGLAVTAALLRTVFIPGTVVLIAVLMGFRGVELGVILILFGAPTAVSSYIMAKNMKSDYVLAGQIMLLTTLFCVGTLFGGILLLKFLALI